MRKYASALVCLVLGSVAGAALPRLAAQAVPAPSSHAPRPTRWEQTCVLKGGIPSDREDRPRAMESLTQSLASRGADGWELVDVPVLMYGGNGVTRSELLLCFKRPAAQ